MRTPNLLIVIAASGRPKLLGRLIETLAACELPPNPLEIVIARNGPLNEPPDPLPPFAGRIPIKVHHTPQGNKSLALNHQIFNAHPDDFIIFFDDDVRVHPRTLIAYADAVAAHQDRVFFGGRCLVDYDEPPPEWMKSYLPASAKGWSLGDEVVRLTVPHALGFNWGAFAGDLCDCGGFNPELGPGTPRGVGEETAVQQQLFARNILGFYLPDAVVWHHVPRERCNEKWTLKRAAQSGYLQGLEYAPQSARDYLRRRLKLVRAGVIVTVLPKFITEERRFHHAYWSHWNRGVFAGRRAAARLRANRR